MSIGRNHPTTGKDTRDPEADFVVAHIEEYEAYTAAGMTEQAAQVADVLRRLGHDIRPARPAAGAKERAVSEPPLETAVPSDETPKRRPGRPKKAEE